MRLTLAVLTLLFLPLSAAAAPFVVSDPVDSRVTHCGVLMDTNAKVVVAVTLEGATKICKYDLAGLPEGSHVVKMTAIANDPVWGSQESAQSLPLAFVKPTTPSVPAGVRLTP